MIKPFPYQADAFSEIMQGFESGSRSQLLILPTGCGKTVTFSFVCRSVIDGGGRVLVLAHREELIQQAANTLAGFGINPVIEMAGNHAMPRFTKNKRTPGLTWKRSGATKSIRTATPSVSWAPSRRSGEAAHGMAAGLVSTGRLR